MNTNMHSPQIDDEDRFNITDAWLRVNPKRWVAGIISGLIAGGVMLFIAGLAAKSKGLGLGYPVRVFAIPAFGERATDYSSSGALIAGAVTAILLFGLLGFLFAHFTSTNRFKPLFFMGLTWGCFGWVFLNNLFGPAFKPIYWQEISQGNAFLLWMVYGASLTSLAVVSKALESNTN